jgi:hypothetical protein
VALPFAVVVRRRRARYREDWVPDLERLVADCDRRLDTIRFLQTHTAGWSGKFTVPFGGEANLSRQRQLARQPLTYPVVIDGIRKTLAEATQALRAVPVGGTRFVIGIDELDKIESADGAQQFVNEIKAMFNAPGCHFVVSVSVSEEALAGFEGHGVRLRDAFDSAFDEIVRLDHLDVTESTRLLQRRVIGLPVPFLLLCHCLTGGLPRDLIRVARRMVDLGRSRPGIRLDAVCRALLTADVERAVRAALARLPAIGTGQDLPALMRRLDPRADGLLTAGAFDAVARDSRAVAMPPAAWTLWIETFGFCYFALTLSEVFDKRLDEARITDRLTGPGSFEALARARQSFAVDPRLAWFALTEVRTTWNLATFDLPDPPPDG